MTDTLERKLYEYTFSAQKALLQDSYQKIYVGQCCNEYDRRYSCGRIGLEIEDIDDFCDALKAYRDKLIASN